MEFLNPKTVLSSLEIFHNAVVCDLGAGPGEFTLLAAEAVGPSGKVYAIDIRHDVLSRIESTAREKGFANIETLTGDLEARDGAHLADNTCDFVIIANVLFQMENKENFLAEAVRILKSNGKILFIEWKDSFNGLGPTKDMVVSPEKAQTFFVNAGIRVLSETPAGAYHYAYILQKP